MIADNFQSKNSAMIPAFSHKMAERTRHFAGGSYQRKLGVSANIRYLKAAMWAKSHRYRHDSHPPNRMKPKAQTAIQAILVRRSMRRSVPVIWFASDPITVAIHRVSITRLAPINWCGACRAGHIASGPIIASLWRPGANDPDADSKRTRGRCHALRPTFCRRN